MQKLFLKWYGLLSILCIWGFSADLKAEVIRIPVVLSWKTTAGNNDAGKQNLRRPVFTDAVFIKVFGDLPLYRKSIALNGDRDIKVSLENISYSAAESGIADPGQLLGDRINVSYSIVYERKQPKVLVSLIPVRTAGGMYERAQSFEIVITYTPGFKTQTFSKAGFASQSVLSSGSWYKINVNQTGVQRIDKAFLKSMGIDPSAVDPRTIKIYGNGPGMLPGLNTAPRTDDLKENAILVKGESDGVFNDDDAILFFGKAQKDVWLFDKTNSVYKHENNIYSDVTCYFLTFGGAAGKRISTVAPSTENSPASSHHDYLYIHESEKSNLIRTGKRWLGEEFNRQTSYNFSVKIPHLDNAQNIFMRSSVAAHSYANSSFSVFVNGAQQISHANISFVGATFEDAFAEGDDQTADFKVTQGNLGITYTYNQPLAGSIGWLDFFEIQARQANVFDGPQLLFSDKATIGSGKITKFIFSSSISPSIWDVTDPSVPEAITASSFNGSELTFVRATDTLRSFLLFDNVTFFTPVASGKTENQNIHGLGPADMFIVTHSDFLSEANRLAVFHRSGGMRVQVITTTQVYNEFSGGVQDISAIRDMMRMFYKRATTNQDLPKYLLLFGRASYDYKNRIANNTNFVPTFESYESFQPVVSYCSDDYYGLLDDGEGSWDIGNDPDEGLDIGIGRFPATTAENAATMVNKTILYVTDPDRGDWKSKTVFVADDEDANDHQEQADILANSVRANFRNYNVQKIFIDAFKEVNTSGGPRNPDAQAEIVRSVERGCFIFNYNGHGGEVGLAAERILNTDDIQNWTNGKRLPLFVTATCEFSRFDDPARFAAGEMVLLNPNGGGIGLFTTVRLVSSGDNFSLNTAFYKYAGLDSAGAGSRLLLGEIMRKTKNDVMTRNSRNFTLLADPALMLAYPTMRAFTTSVNTHAVPAPDTLKAYSKVTITGKVTDLNGNLMAGYNGIVYPTLFDKVSTYETVVNNPGGFNGSQPYSFLLQNNVIHRGKATVKNGVFSFSFIVPKDIAYQVGYGRISYYAENGSTDALGYDESVLVGGTADSIGKDATGPEIKLYLNDERFVFGGLTNQDPLLIAKLADFNGINITGQGIGREISMSLNNSTKITTLNDYYQTKTDSYQEGEVRFKIKGLPAGKNSLKLTAWDVYNNYGEATLDFVVASSEEMALDHVLNYPNPFTTHTTFHFDHNKPGEDLKVMIQVFTLNGKLIKTLQTETATSGNHFDKLTWDGLDDYGDNIGKGVYIYKVKVKSTGGKAAEEFQKLVILN